MFLKSANLFSYLSDSRFNPVKNAF